MFPNLRKNTVIEAVLKHDVKWAYKVGCNRLEKFVRNAIRTTVAAGAGFQCFEHSRLSAVKQKVIFGAGVDRRTDVGGR
jgi:hypothetical protein